MMPQQTQKVRVPQTPGAESDAVHTSVNLAELQRYAGFTVA